MKAKRVIDLDCHAYETPVQGHTYKDEHHMHALGQYQDYTKELIASMDAHGLAKVALYPSLVPYEKVRDTSFQEYPERFIRTSTLPTAASRGKQLTPAELAAIFKEHLEQDGCRIIGSGGMIAGMLTKYSVQEMAPVADLILEHEVPVEYHTGWTATGSAMAYGRKYTTAEDWVAGAAALMQAFPEMTVILQDGGGSIATPDGHAAIRLLFSYDNAYFDTGKSTPEIVTEAVRGAGAERVMFASDWNRPQLKEYGPYHMRAVYQHWWNLNTIANADLTEDQRDWVLHKSAEKLLKLSTS
ncbi:MAG TPA: amidohydrolase family protein [Acidobacteriaceae bacterium]|nr:amidohydrolase family protein [Acidobacteriaceae bacterium]